MSLCLNSTKSIFPEIAMVHGNSRPSLAYIAQRGHLYLEKDAVPYNVVRYCYVKASFKCHPGISNFASPRSVIGVDSIPSTNELITHYSVSHVFSRLCKVVLMYLF